MSNTQRPIKFRGKSIETGEWVYGGIEFTIAGVRIFPENTDKVYNAGIGIWVKPETVGQFTGLMDKNGREILEGDVVRENTESFGPSKLHYVVGYERGHFTLTEIGSGYDRMGIWNVHHNMEVIGNIYENPDLLKNNN